MNGLFSADIENRGLVLDPRTKLAVTLLVFDEPTSGLDFRSMESTAALLRKLDKAITVLIVTHDMELIERCCTHILHIEAGRADSR